MRQMTLRELPGIETELLSGRLTVSFAAETLLGGNPLKRLRDFVWGDIANENMTTFDDRIAGNVVKSHHF